jgi:hypothetical protein
VLLEAVVLENNDLQPIDTLLEPVSLLFNEPAPTPVL